MFDVDHLASNGGARLAGASAADLDRRSALVQLLALPFPVCLAISAWHHAGTLAAVSFVLLLMPVAARLIIFRRGWNKRTQEVERGYTSIPEIWAANQDLYLVDARTLNVVLHPTLPWRSKAGDRRYASVVGDRHIGANYAWAARAAIRAEIAEAVREQESRSAIE